MKPQAPMLSLNNGAQIPQLGLGVWQAKDGKEVEKAVSAALEAGYRLIDTAAAYGNEAGVGRAIKASGIPREEIFITTKLWNADHGHDNALKAFDTSLKNLGLDYIDLYLIHWPVPAQDKYVETWKALEEIYEGKRVDSIGVSNFMPEHLEALLKEATVMPSVDQIELHPRLQQREMRELAKQHDILIESWSPLMRGGELLQNEVITAIARKYNKTPAQIIIRWHIQSGLIVIPKSVHPERIRENIDVFDFELIQEEIMAINDLDREERTGPDPRTANFT